MPSLDSLSRKMDVSKYLACFLFIVGAMICDGKVCYIMTLEGNNCMRWGLLKEGVEECTTLKLGGFLLGQKRREEFIKLRRPFISDNSEEVAKFLQKHVFTRAIWDAGTLAPITTVMDGPRTEPPSSNPNNDTMNTLTTFKIKTSNTDDGHTTAEQNVGVTNHEPTTSGVDGVGLSSQGADTTSSNASPVTLETTTKIVGIAPDDQGTSSNPAISTVTVNTEISADALVASDNSPIDNAAARSDGVNADVPGTITVASTEVFSHASDDSEFISYMTSTFMTEGLGLSPGEEVVSVNTQTNTMNTNTVARSVRASSDSSETNGYPTINAVTMNSETTVEMASTSSHPSTNIVMASTISQTPNEVDKGATVTAPSQWSGHREPSTVDPNHDASTGELRASTDTKRSSGPLDGAVSLGGYSVYSTLADTTPRSEPKITSVLTSSTREDNSRLPESTMSRSIHSETHGDRGQSTFTADPTDSPSDTLASNAVTENTEIMATSEVLVTSSSMSSTFAQNKEITQNDLRTSTPQEEDNSGPTIVTVTTGINVAPGVLATDITEVISDAGRIEDITDCTERSGSTTYRSPQSTTEDSCPEGFDTILADSCYLTVTDVAHSRDAAKMACESFSSHLVFIESAEEKDFLQGVYSLGDEYWIGANGRQSEVKTWDDGANITYSYFGSGTNTFNDDSGCYKIMATDRILLALLYGALHSWNDSSCAAEKSFICEYELGRE